MFSIVKKLLTIFLLINYFFGINAPLIAYFEYKVNYDFIVKNLCVQKDNPDNQCQGSCHLKKNLDKSDEENKKSEKQYPEFNFFTLSHHIGKGKFIDDFFFESSSKYSSLEDYRLIFNQKNPECPPHELL